MEVRKLRTFDGKQLTSEEYRELLAEIKETLYEIGFTCEVVPETVTSFRISKVRLRVDVWPYNISPYTGRRGRILNYYQWGLVNHALNAIFEKHWYRAKITSLKGLFVIRDDIAKYGFREWEHLEGDNVGSVFNPVCRVDAWEPEDYERYEKAYSDALKRLIEKYPDSSEYLKGAAFYVLSPKYSKVVMFA